MYTAVVKKSSGFIAAAVAAAGVILPILLHAQVRLVGAASDTNYSGFNNSITVLQPQYWVVQENSFVTIKGQNLDYISLSDQSEQGGRITRSVDILHSTPAGIFSLPVGVASRLSRGDMVNYYIDQVLRTTIGSRVINTSVHDQQGDKVFSVEWEYISTSKLTFIVLDEFIFHKSDVYQVDGQYATFNPSMRDVIMKIEQSVKFNQ